MPSDAVIASQAGRTPQEQRELLNEIAKVKDDVRAGSGDGDAGNGNNRVRGVSPGVQPVAPSAAKAPSPLPDVLPAGTRCTSGATLTGGIARLVTGPLNWYDAVEPARWVCKGYTAGGVTPEAIDWSSFTPPAPNPSPEPLAVELVKLYEATLAQPGPFGGRRNAALALYTRGRSDEAARHEAEIAALRRFVEMARLRYAGDLAFDCQLAELEAELAKAAGGGGTEG